LSDEKAAFAAPVAEREFILQHGIRPNLRTEIYGQNFSKS